MENDSLREEVRNLTRAVHDLSARLVATESVLIASVGLMPEQHRHALETALLSLQGGWSEATYYSEMQMQDMADLHRAALLKLIRMS